MCSKQYLAAFVGLYAVCAVQLSHFCCRWDVLSSSSFRVGVVKGFVLYSRTSSLSRLLHAAPIHSMDWS
ncbi:uncharacterized protein BP01DRAFT_195094 [Aspergillus saccharolyticus JOP 1030-1]|uniref:Uncharacterized protein n=1 Tax=Aspergillus saccharolyticus JOP 1030-1 TaxID=1450539 RepID=A0A319A6S8_9EURO|nr:hypothetical protein BP01DRAFT_195094 [Aspergillus saccharolyticus JOP 1030-1]PYH47698.1 hypothetical protein BP01DRAFT_195094 [Aspergillus saccharolyticus JOP 1030-1]